jgi:hypothetical protein
VGSITTVGSFLTNLRTRLIARTNLAAVPVYTATVDHLSVGQEAIVFGVENIVAAFGYRTLPQIEVSEEYPVEGRIWVVKAGAGETTIASARDRTIAIFGEVVDELKTCNTASATLDATANTLATLGVDDARISSWRLEQYAADGGRDARIMFNVNVKARFTPA